MGAPDFSRSSFTSLASIFSLTVFSLFSEFLGPFRGFLSIGLRPAGVCGRPPWPLKQKRGQGGHPENFKFAASRAVYLARASRRSQPHRRWRKKSVARNPGGHASFTMHTSMRRKD
jgi:hypothetical protein